MTKVKRIPITQRTWEWYKKEILRLKELDNKITDRVRASYEVGNKKE
jgi:hypothetical protein